MGQRLRYPRQLQVLALDERVRISFGALIFLVFEGGLTLKSFSRVSYADDMTYRCIDFIPTMPRLYNVTGGPCLIYAFFNTAHSHSAREYGELVINQNKAPATSREFVSNDAMLNPQSLSF